MLELRLKSHLSVGEAAALKGQQLSGRHYTSLFCESVAVREKNNDLVAALIKDVIPMRVLSEVHPHLLTMRGTLANRATVVRAGAQMNRIRRDGLLSPRRVVPKTVLEAHGGRGSQLGFFDFDHARSCRETSWTAERPDVLLGCTELLGHVSEVYRQTLPRHYARQMAKVALIPSYLRLGASPFTTITVNWNNRTSAHTDKGDVRDGFGCMTTHGSFKGGYFIMPRFGIAFDVRPGDLLLANVHELHGNSAMAGERLSCVYYARERMHLCASRQTYAKAA